MIKFLCMYAFIISSISIADPVYLDLSEYGKIKSQMPKPPTANSKEQRDDENELRKFQKTRTNAQCMQARNEANGDLMSFFGPPTGSLTDKEIESVSSLLNQVRSDIGFFIGNLKKDFPRKRPYFELKDISPCLDKDDSGAYPSGHGTLSKIYMMILADLFPAVKSKLESRAIEIGKNRVIAGVHYPTDIEAGRKLADLLYLELGKSKKFHDDFNALKSQVRRN